LPEAQRWLGDLWSAGDANRPFAKNSILYLYFVVERGHTPFQNALTEAARLRFPLIIMTTLTVLGGCALYDEDLCATEQ
jgi:hypothetical protein